jgi:SAM-dependent methyltransferase
VGANVTDPSNLTAESNAIWEQIADFWDGRMAEGNQFHLQLIAPSAARLLAIRPGERVLDIACGNGQFSRQLAELGATVVASDVSPSFVERAKARTAELPAEVAARVSYHVADATDEAALLALSDEPFDAAISNMALMDIPDIAPLMRAVKQMVRPGGCFVVTLQHPCFNSNGMRFSMEEEDRGGEIVVTRAAKIVQYLHLPPGRGTGIVGQPAPHWYFHRPLSVLFAPAFAAGLVIDGLEEPSFPEASPTGRSFDWASFPEVPPVLAVRFRIS